jgi:Asp-tRNA(Asn)/Glu-tRNA(Gln) amidotransferase C subunit
MILTEEEFEKIIQIARLKIAPEKKQKLLSDLRMLLEHMEIIDDPHIDITAESSPAVHDSQAVDVD